MRQLSFRLADHMFQTWHQKGVLLLIQAESNWREFKKNCGRWCPLHCTLSFIIPN